ncbi:gibberellin 2-beta-dioxygenase 3 [Canna indica]|uniref:Gibberellin 2-beta-dioxygenase 3 n=1 Tax=Canna indica TaxID=4628 RepID=A0AAQ3QKZ1_9LILI|nr:gibberellin 2-beta-dioxygenase 3 [Canna indica]
MFGPANPFSYGNKRISPNGDIGWVEYLLFLVTSNPSFPWSMVFLDDSSTASFRLISQRGVEQVPDGGEEVGRRGARIDGARVEDEAEGCTEQAGDGQISLFSSLTAAVAHPATPSTVFSFSSLAAPPAVSEMRDLGPDDPRDWRCSSMPHAMPSLTRDPKAIDHVLKAISALFASPSTYL